ncbi:GH24 family phage-related lysozyme (muramidase) [Arthrobacter pigmenti]|uniref:GH24 family phage-related lysozyme (Muramidase) n=1 Tax=Arthrobacter pigmenti TaxID=271432 RepID=A0A846RJV9_9MICC|nr:hypothetical protein [Arthrobacter pigmenti]NJC23598.1 GH24 family phage-related lysozyme (muramidase) [Arthrobacter pigmenti]
MSENPELGREQEPAADEERDWQSANQDEQAVARRRREAEEKLNERQEETGHGEED